MSDIMGKADTVLRESHRFKIGDRVRFALDDGYGKYLVRGEIRDIALKGYYEPVYKILLDNPFHKSDKDDLPRELMRVGENFLEFDTLDYMRRKKR